MKIVYLDQWCISNIAKKLDPSLVKGKANVDDVWEEIYELLQELVRQNAIICPISNVHSLEIAEVTKPRLHNLLVEILWQLSKQNKFLDSDIIAAQQFRTFVKTKREGGEYRIGLETFIERMPDSEKRYFGKYVSTAILMQEQFEKEVKSKWKQMNFEQCLSDELNGILREAIKRWPLQFWGIKYDNAQWLDALKEIPYAILNSILRAAEAHEVTSSEKSRRSLLSDWNDVESFSHFLPYCDIFTCDHYWKKRFEFAKARALVPALKAVICSSPTELKNALDSLNKQ